MKIISLNDWESKQKLSWAAYGVLQFLLHMQGQAHIKDILENAPDPLEGKKAIQELKEKGYLNEK